MILDMLNASPWREWLNLSADQAAAVELGIKTVNESEKLADMLSCDVQALAAQTENRTPDEQLIPLYGEELYRIHTVLILICRLPWLIEQYRKHSIPDETLRDTMMDVHIWMNVCKKKTGYQGLLEYGWLVGHFSFRLFRLGRLQFIYQPSGTPVYVYKNKDTQTVMGLCPDGSRFYTDGDGVNPEFRPNEETWTASLKEENGYISGFPFHPHGFALRTPVKLNLSKWECVLKPNDPVLDMHIAEGCPLSPDAVAQSLQIAPAFFRDHFGITDIKAMTCGSWLLDNNIAQIQPNGNIAAFQKHFYLISHEGADDRQTRQRAFGDYDVDIMQAECRTSLQKAIRAWYDAGRRCRHSAGFILL